MYMCVHCVYISVYYVPVATKDFLGELLDECTVADHRVASGSHDKHLFLDNYY